MTVALVTGGAGFIGSHLVEALLGKGYAVRVLDNLSTGDPANLAGLEVDLIQADVTDAAAIEAAVAGAEVVFHLAAMISVPESMQDPPACYRVNLLGSVNVLEAARRHGVRRVVLASTCAVYGDLTGPASEDLPPRPLSPYADSKRAMEAAAALYSRAFGLSTVSLRYFNVYGPRQRPDSPYAAVIPIFVRRMLAGQAPVIYGDGRQTRDFVYVGDVVRANLLAAEAPEASGEVVNVGSGRSVSILQLAEYLAKRLPEAPAPEFAPPRPGDIRHSVADLTRAGAWGYRPEIALERGLELTIEWFRAAEAQRTG